MGQLAVGAPGGPRPVCATAPSTGGWRPGQELVLRVVALGDGVLLEGEGGTLSVPAWAQAELGQCLRFRVLEAWPRLLLQPLPLEQAATPAATTTLAALEPGWRPRLTPERQGVPVLAPAWREAVLGRLLACRQDFLREGGRQLPGFLLGAAPELALGGAHEAPFPLWLPAWLWGGPQLALSLEQGEGDDGSAALDLVLEFDWDGVGRVGLRLRRSGVVLLLLWGEEAVRRRLLAMQHRLSQAALRAGVAVQLAIAGYDVMKGRALLRPEACQVTSSRVEAELFAVAAAVVECVLEDGGRL